MHWRQDNRATQEFSAVVFMISEDYLSSDYKDHFSDRSQAYRVYRPGYPDDLFSYLSSLTKEHKRAWDCGTGSGQSAIALAKYFSEVIGTDASENQIKNAAVKEGVIYKVEKAENTSIASDSVDLITVAQAVHWFNNAEFSREVMRVLKPEGKLAIWTYGLFTVSPEINAVIDNLYGPVLDAYWPAERKEVESGYQNISFPMPEIQTPEFQMDTEWDLTQLTGYLCTWSAVKRYEADLGVNPVTARYEEILNHWGNPKQKRTFKWPLTLRVWVKNT